MTLAVLGVVGVALGAVMLLSDGGAEAEPRSIDLLPPPPPPTFPAGEPVFENPPDPTVTDRSLLQRHGDYLIYPAGFVGTLEVERTVPLPPNRGVASSDLEVLKASTLYVEVEGIPGDLKQYEITTGEGTSEVILVQTFGKPPQKGEVHELTVERARRPDRPIIIGAPPETNSALTLSLEFIEGREALVWRTIPGSRPPDAPLTFVRFFDALNEVETLISGDGVAESAVLAAAHEIARKGNER